MTNKVAAMGLVFVLAPACGEELPSSASIAPSRGLSVQNPGPDAGTVDAPGAPSADRPSSSSSSASASIHRMLPRVERLRELRATRDVPGMAIDRRSLMLRVRQHVARELPQEAIRNEGRELELLGLLPIGFDYEAAEYQLLEDQLAGYYEPADHTMYLASDLDAQDSDATLAHELVHALQDQNLASRQPFSISPRRKRRRGGHQCTCRRRCHERNARLRNRINLARVRKTRP